eukprot:2382468-Rhodomonas_salina.1
MEERDLAEGGGLMPPAAPRTRRVPCAWRDEAHGPFASSPEEKEGESHAGPSSGREVPDSRRS